MSFACECGVERALQKVWHRSLSRKALALGLSAYLTQVARTLWAWGTQRPMPLPCVGVHLHIACDAVLCDRFVPESRDPKSCWFVTM